MKMEATGWTPAPIILPSPTRCTYHPPVAQASQFCYSSRMASNTINCIRKQLKRKQILHGLGCDVIFREDQMNKENTAG